MKRRFASVLLAFVLFSISVISTSSAVFAAEEIPGYSHEDYKKDIKEGYVGEDVSYQQLVNLNSEALELENNDNFATIYEAKNFQDFSDFHSDSQILRANLVHFNPGDVITMNSHASHGLAGHAVLALSDVSFLSIQPETGRVTLIMDRATFKSRYSGRNIKVFRPNNYNWGVSAAQWAHKTYWDRSKFTYHIGTDLTDIYNTYCSKAVYHTYKFGVGSIAVNSPSATIGLIHPNNLYVWIKVVRVGEIDTSIMKKDSYISEDM